jgi:hypothetical protein
MTKTVNRVNEVALACQKGVFFINIGKGNLGLTARDIKGLDFTNSKQFNYVRNSEEYEAHRQASVFG